MKITYTGLQGFTLVELMIALTLGAILSTAMLQVVIANVRTHQTSIDIARLQENGRLAMDILSRDLRLAGYHPPDIPDLEILRWDCLPRTPCSSDGPGQQSDTIAVQYITTPTSDRDCTGARIDVGTLIVNTYSVRDVDGDGIRSLYCRGFSETRGTYTSNTTPLVDGIDALQVLYKVFLPESGAYSYRSLDRMTAVDFSNIHAANIALLVGNGLPQGSAQSRTRSYQLLDADPLVFDNDRHLRRIFNTTVQFNNRRQEVSQ